MDQRRPLSMTTYYGCMRAFVSVFTGELAMVGDLVSRLEGQRLTRAFGWQSALERALRRASTILERWKGLCEEVVVRLQPDELERRIYGQNPLSGAKSLQIASDLSDRMRRLCDHLQDLDAVGPQDVRWVSGVAREMVQAIDAEARTASLVSSYLERGASDPRKSPAAEPPSDAEKGETLAGCLRAFLAAQDGFREDLEDQ